MALERFKRLPQKSEDEWRGGLVRMPTWIERSPDGRPYRPWAGIWVSRKSGFVHFKIEPEPDSHDWTLALDALVEFGLKRQLTGYRPGRLQITDKELGTRLLDALGDEDIAVTVLRDLPAVRRVRARMTEYMARRREIAGAPPVFLTFDDGGVSCHAPIGGMLEQFGWRGHFFITTSRIGTPGFLSEAQVRDLHRRGHVIGSHSHTHPTRMAALAPDRMESEWRQSLAHLAEILGETREGSLRTGRLLLAAGWPQRRGGRH